MADRARIGTFINGRFSTILDVNDGTTYAFQREAFKLTPPQPQQTISQSERRYGGARVVGETHGNGAIEATWYVGGAGNPDTAVQNAETLIAALSSPASNRYMEWRPDGAALSVYYELRGPSPGWEPQWKWIEWMQNRAIALRGVFQTAPLAVGDPMDISDPWTANFLADYTFDAATSADVASSGGALTPVVGAALNVERRFRHTAKGYRMVEHQDLIPFTVGSTVTGFKVGGLLQGTGPNDYLEGYTDDDGTNSRLRIDKVVGAARTNLATVNLPLRLVAGSTYYLRPRREGMTVFVDIFNSPPNIIDTPPDSTISYSLTTAEQGTFAPGGFGGISWVPQHASASIGALRIEPFYYYGQGGAGNQGVTPQPTPISVGTVPGTASALADVSLSMSGFLPSQFGLIGWAPRVTGGNYATNGDFEVDTSGWSPAGSAFTQSGATLSWYSSGAKFGVHAMQVATAGGTVNQGAFFRLYGVFRRGVTYTYSAWVKASAGTQTIQIGMGSTGTGSDSGAGASPALTTSYQQLTGTWTPSADRTDAQVFVRIPGSTAQTFQIDAYQVYQGLTAPTSYPQSEGRGAFSTFGPIPAPSYDAAASTGFSITTPAAGNAISGQVARWATGGAQGVLSLWIDPSMVGADTFAGLDQRVEIWVRAYVPSLVTRMTIAASVKSALAVGPERFTGEFGSAGKSCIIPSFAAPGSAWRHYRLGTMNLSADPSNPHRYKLTLYLNSGAGSSGNVDLDYVLLLPSQQRAASPSSKDSSSGYPTFYGAISNNKTIRTDLSGATTTSLFAPSMPDHGLGGQLLEIGPGPTDMMVTAFNLVPDDPFLSNASDASVVNKVPFHLAVIPRYFLARGS